MYWLAEGYWIVIGDSLSLYIRVGDNWREDDRWVVKYLDSGLMVFGESA